MTKEEYQRFAMEFIRKWAAGEATLEDQLRVFAEMPPELAANFLFGPDEVAALKEGLAPLIWAKEDRTSAEASQARAVMAATGMPIEQFEQFLNAIPVVKKAAAGKGGLSAESLAAFAAVVKRLRREQGINREAADMVADLAKAAGVTDDKAAAKAASDLVMAQPDLPASPKLKDFQLGILQTFLLENWACIVGWEPILGLCDFSKNALLQYVVARLTPPTVEMDTATKPQHGTQPSTTNQTGTTDRGITSGAIEKQRQRAGLKRRLPSRVKSVERRSLLQRKRANDPITLVLKRGQKIVHRLSIL